MLKDRALAIYRSALPGLGGVGTSGGMAFLVLTIGRSTETWAEPKAGRRPEYDPGLGRPADWRRLMLANLRDHFEARFPDETRVAIGFMGSSMICFTRTASVCVEVPDLHPGSDRRRQMAASRAADLLAEVS